MVSHNYLRNEKKGDFIWFSFILVYSKRRYTTIISIEFWYAYAILIRLNQWWSIRFENKISAFNELVTSCVCVCVWSEIPFQQVWNFTNLFSLSLLLSFHFWYGIVDLIFGVKWNLTQNELNHLKMISDRIEIRDIKMCEEAIVRYSLR